MTLDPVVLSNSSPRGIGFRLRKLALAAFRDKARPELLDRFLQPTASSSPEYRPIHNVAFSTGNGLYCFAHGIDVKAAKQLFLCSDTSPRKQLLPSIRETSLLSGVEYREGRL